MNSSTDSDVHAESEAPWALLDDATVDVDGWLRGRFLAFLPVAAVNRRPYELHLELRRRDDCESQRLYGALIALSPAAVVVTQSRHTKLVTLSRIGHLQGHFSS